MKKVIFEKSILSCVLIFLICCIARVVEYFGIRTDETILAENFIHKVFGIIILGQPRHFFVFAQHGQTFIQWRSKMTGKYTQVNI